MFCIYCGAKINDDANFCTKCGKPVKKAEEAVAEENVTAEEVTVVEEAVSVEGNAPAEEVMAVEEVVSVEENAPAEEVAAVEEVVSVEENTSVEEVTVVEEAVPVEENAPAEEVTAVEEAVTMEETVPAEEKIIEPVEKVSTPPKKKSLAKKNLTAVVTYIISAAVIAGIGLFAAPKLFRSAIENAAEKSAPETALTLYKAAENDTAVANAKFAIAKNALESENYAYAAALFAELKSEDYAADTDLTSYIDEAFGGRCRVLINGGKYNLAEADSTQVSDALLRASIANDTLVSRAKLLSADGKNSEAYKMVSLVNTSAAYDSNSYNIIVYNYAVEFYNQMMFAETYEILANATDEASVELRCSAAYHLADNYLQDKNYEKAIEMYENAEGYGNSADKLRQCNYQLGLIYYNQSKLEEALECFTAADGFKDSASYIKEIEEKKAYTGWKVEGFSTDYVNTITGRPNPEKTRIAASDDFIYYFTVTNENNNTNGITINVQITTPDGQTASETITDIHNGDVSCYSAGYEFPQYGALGRAYFTVTLVETGEVLDICYFEIY